MPGERIDNLPAKPEIEQISEVQTEMPEGFVEPKEKSGKWKIVKRGVEIEGKKVEVSYREKVIELPKHRQEETGINRIRRREVIDLPEFFGKGFPYASIDKAYASGDFAEEDYYKCLDYIRFLTDGRFPSNYTWSHVFLGDHGLRTNFAEKSIENFRREGLYFQQIRPITEKFTDTYDTIETTASAGNKYYHKFSDDKSNFNLSVALREKGPYGGALWMEGQHLQPSI